MIIVVIYWKIKLGNEHRRAFLDHWEKTLTIPERSLRSAVSHKLRRVDHQRYSCCSGISHAPWGSPIHQSNTTVHHCHRRR